jgi:hypothetical protein
MTKGNWVGGPNARLDRTDDRPSGKNIAESMEWVRKIGEEILVDQNRKENKNREGFLGC